MLHWHIKTSDKDRFPRQRLRWRNTKRAVGGNGLPKPESRRLQISRRYRCQKLHDPLVLAHGRRNGQLQLRKLRSQLLYQGWNVFARMFTHAKQQRPDGDLLKLRRAYYYILQGTG